CNPFSRPSHFGRVVNKTEGLQGHWFDSTFRQSTPEVVPLTPHPQRGSPDGASEIERKNLGPRITPELQRNKRQEDTFAAACRTPHQGMADVTYVERQPKRGGAVCLPE